ncbi:unnamed protein product, partial [Phaeothamnion confervicola]
AAAAVAAPTALAATASDVTAAPLSAAPAAIAADGAVAVPAAPPALPPPPQQKQHERRIVDLQSGTCSCLQWQQRGVPCRHAVAAARAHRDAMADARRWFRHCFDPIFYVERLRRAYPSDRGVMMPLEENLVADGVTLPPAPP